MFDKQYHVLVEQVRPDEKLIQATIKKAQAYQKTYVRKPFLFRKPAMVCASFCLCIFLAMPTIAARIGPIYELMYLVSPAVAQFFMPVQKSDEDNGIKMEVVSAYIHENKAEIYITMQDLSGDRIDETTDLFDSYSINRPFDSSAHCERVGYDETTKKATFLISVEEWGKQNIKGDKLTFSVREFLSHKKTYDDIKIPISLSSVNVAKRTQPVSNLTGRGGIDFKKYVASDENLLALDPALPIEAFPVEGIDLTGIGYIDGKLHIQTAVKDNLDKDNHGFFYLKDSYGNQIDSNYGFNFVNQYEQPGRIDYCNYVFDVPQSEISKYTLCGDFVCFGKVTKGNWRVTFPLEKGTGIQE